MRSLIVLALLAGASLGIVGMSYASKPDDVEMVTEWYVTVTENDVERTLQPVTPDDHSSFRVFIDQSLAPGWGCVVRPQVWHGTRRWRWLTCERGAAKVQIKTDCRSDRAGARSQELWLGDQVALRLDCRSGVSP